MRLIYTTLNSEQGPIFANFLTSEGIENQLEMVRGNDWGQENYGDTSSRIWVIDEDLADAAEKWAATFEKDPHNPSFQRTGFKTNVIPAIDIPSADNSSSSRDSNLVNGRGNRPVREEKLQSITMGILLLCCLFYIISNMTAPSISVIPTNVPPTPVFSATIKKQFLYDYPRTYEIVDKMINLYGVEKLQNPRDLPIEGQYLFKEMQKTPYWDGYYNKVLAYFKNTPIPENGAPMFEKIRQGEVWRLFTPALMHTDFLHILFNVLWLIILGKQLEQRLTPRRYILLILIIGIVSNTAQYLMSGSNFIGLSGVICGLVAFICVRQKIAPWEGYPLERSTSMFILYFIMALMIIQSVSFYLEANNNMSISPGIANTAHLTGAFVGALLGFLPLFKKNNNIARPNR